MDDLRILTSGEFEELKDIEEATETAHHGFVYVIDYGDFVKIGHTRRPYLRFKQHMNGLKNYGKNIDVYNMLITPPHTNHSENERLVHAFFSDFRKEGTELFYIPFNKVVQVFPSIGLVYRDDSKEMNRRAAAMLNTLYAMTAEWREDASAEDKIALMESQSALIESQCDLAEEWLELAKMYDDPDFNQICFYYGTKALHNDVPVVPFPQEAAERWKAKCEEGLGF